MFILKLTAGQVSQQLRMEQEVIDVASQIIAQVMREASG